MSEIQTLRAQMRSDFEWTIKALRDIADRMHVMQQNFDTGLERIEAEQQRLADTVGRPLPSDRGLADTGQPD